ncbi:hypothetical protein BGX27_002496 [Mortierella sp. AM989]|nr:hypothetical protein BGX27_002496 [Mortierella sp. AM989]
MKQRISLGVAGLMALSCALSMVNAHEEAKSSEEQVNSEIPSFKSTLIKAPFLEQFANGWTDNWQVSTATKESEKEGEIFSYIGQWAVEEPHVFLGMKGDMGLVAKSAAAHHAISASIPEVVDNTGKTLVVQYEVKAQDGLACGGAYLKLLTDSLDGVKFKEFSNETPYTIMFGPDKCGTTDKVHFIFRHKNPVSGNYEEKHLQKAPQTKLSKLSNLYTLVVRPDQTFEIRINGDVVSSGSLLKDFEPAVNPSREIDDPKDTKPTNWVEEAKIPDAKAVKPEDWDENALPRIPDENATKPKDWLENEEAEIPDPEAVKPEDWDDEEDGDWIAPSVPNPKCQNNGCGEWVRPSIQNPEYKGKWSAPLIDNPEYKGVWAPRKIPNPGFFEDLSPSNFEKIGAVGFEIWTMQSDILFDNIYVGHSVTDAEALAAESWEPKHNAEKQLEEKANPPPEPTADDKTILFTENPFGFIYEHLREFVELALEDPIHAVNSRPLAISVIAGFIGVSFGLMLIVLGLMSGTPDTPDSVAAAKKTDSAAADVQSDDSKAGTSTKKGSEEPKEDSSVRKRTTVADSDE